MSVSKYVNLDGVITFLNDLVKKDPEWVAFLAAYRPKCNAAIAAHPSVQVASIEDGVYHAGLIGLLNGIFSDGENKLAAVVSEHTDIDLGRITAFTKVPISTGNDNAIT
jgi:hypothetical protein